MHILLACYISHQILMFELRDQACQLLQAIYCSTFSQAKRAFVKYCSFYHSAPRLEGGERQHRSEEALDTFKTYSKDSMKTLSIVFYDTNKIRQISLQTFTEQFSLALRSSRLEFFNACKGTKALQSQFVRQFTASRSCHSVV